MQYFVIASRALIGVIFLVALVHKVVRRPRCAAFVDSAGVMRLGPTPLAGSAAGTVVAAEGTICVLLAVPADAAVAAGFAVAAWLLSAYAVGIGHTIRRGATTSGRRSGPSAAALGSRHIGRNALLIAVSMGGELAVLARPPAATAAGTAMATCAGLVAGVLVIVMDDLAALFGATTIDSTRR
ncbi:hypothetical protein DFR70_101836 [Nocardia tenerifensis]|uniref:Methylamine utilisation protein MauE domain-containing protein n=1 Tax=Nocardia tenerifensis TaxID=228006 RepID=A0A318KGV0_9NOCA|nr:MauE/DoxX family redox-associated membrane protein [Nocardia tenerifensis]PXX71413.1 hypothetical protein DFR70_101836 [Nocardia tenerifensis]